MTVVFFNVLAGMEFTAPAAPAEANKYLPSEINSFGDGVWHVVKSIFYELNPSVKEAAGICVCLIAIVLVISIFQSFAGLSKEFVRLSGTVVVALTLIKPSNTLIHLGVSTIEQISTYGKLLIPVMTASLAAQGGVSTSGALYAGTAIFNTVLSATIVSLFIPVLYIYLVISIANSAIGNEMLKQIQKFIKWLMTWLLKLATLIFTGYISITGVVSGAVDTSALKAAKIAISGAVPVVGGLMSDASEAILVSAGLMKNAAGVFGLLTILSLWLAPFLKIAVHYLLLKITAAFCSAFGHKETCGLIQDFAGVMGLTLAATGVMCLLFLISTVCFMRGML